MKKIVISAGLMVFVCLFAGIANARSIRQTDTTGTDADNFNLEAALELFKKAASIEAFEQQLNTENNDVNNLDLNDDGETDYIKVIDRNEGDAHAFVLQAIISATENQDVAVIELEKTGADAATVQIVGDEEIFGEETIVEPTEDAKAYITVPEHSGRQAGPSADFSTNAIVVNVWFWPSVRFVYGPVYRPWISPWGWHRHAVWYRPWRPVYFHVWSPRRAYYRPHYVVVHTHRTVHARRIYTPARVNSVTVRTHHQTITRKTTTVQGRNGRKVKQTKIIRRRH
jgi:hypothetical protein